MIGYFDESGRPKIKFKIEGLRKSGEIAALLDTGFTGSLALPPQYLITIGSELIGIEPMVYADGRVSNELLFRIKSYLNGESKWIAAHLVTGASEPIAGNQLFYPYVVLIDFMGKKLNLVRKEVFDKIIEEQEKLKQ